MQDTAIIILAAGASRRLGQAKQLVKFEQKTLLRHTVEAACQVVENVWVVLGANAERLIPELSNLPIHIIKNENWQSGMASSIKLGLAAAIAQNIDLQLLVVTVCDQPKISAAVFQRMFMEKKRSGKNIVACRYADILGVPVLFEHVYFPSIMTLEGEQGAKKILAANAAEVAFVDFPEGEWDVDTPDDLPDVIAVKAQKNTDGTPGKP